MTVFNEPTQWDHTLGINADTSTLPDDAAATAGIASLQKLFQIINATPLEAGGIAPAREDVNALFKYLGDQIFYTQNGGVPSYNAAYDYIPGRVVLYDNNLYKCIQANSSTSPKAPTNSAYWVKVATLADFANFANIDLSNLSQTGLTKIIPTSTILPFAGSTVPNGWLLCNGAGVSRTTFSNLFTKIGTTYGKGNGSTTFNIPDLRDRYIIGANTNALGTYIAEQLPNIKGQCYQRGDVDKIYAPSYGTGALYGNVLDDNWGMHGGAITGWRLINTSLDASRSASTYVDSGKVYPASIALNFIIKT